MKQLGLAIQLFNDKQKALPAGAHWFSSPPKPPLCDRCGTIHMFLLPFIEEQSLYDSFNFKTPDPVTGTDCQRLPSGTPIGHTVVSTFICPSEMRREGVETRGVEAV